jgi:pimeloyl-ACP methyl ester carboxylesterase
MSIRTLGLAAALVGALTTPSFAQTVRLPSGVEIAYKSAGSGPETMILIHGWSFSHAMWDKVLATPPAGWRLVAYDMRGFGASSKPADGYDYAGMSADLLGLMDQLGIRQAVLAGHSLGSFFIQDVAASHPDRVSALVLTAPQPRTIQLTMVPPIQALIDSVGPDKDRMAAFRANTPRYFAPGALSAADTERFLAINMQASPMALQASLSAAFSAAPIPAQRFQARPVPTLVILGTHDIVPLGVVRQITTDMPGSCAVLIERAGHTPPWETPDRWLALTMAFVSKPAAERRCS